MGYWRPSRDGTISRMGMELTGIGNFGPLLTLVYGALAITFAIGAFVAVRRRRRGVAIALGLLAGWAFLGWVALFIESGQYA